MATSRESRVVSKNKKNEGMNRGWKNRWTLILLAAVLALGGCARKQPAVAELQGQPGPGSAFRMMLHLRPNPPKYNQDVRLRVGLMDLSGKPVEGASVTAHLVMADMDMGENKVALSDVGGGNYEGVGRFSMGGKYNVAVEAFKGGTTGKVTFSVEVAL